jgi:ADP-ribose pyrophosphatase YjhB (NUDIX family)
MACVDENQAVQFNYRVVGIVIHDGRVLAHRGEDEAFWTLPGGHAEPMEPAAVTLKRELREELGVEVEVGRLVWVVENFFTWNRRRWHELALYFLVQPSPTAAMITRTEAFGGSEAASKLLFRWFDLDQLTDLELYPGFLRRELRAVPATTTHIVWTDPETEAHLSEP